MITRELRASAGKMSRNSLILKDNQNGCKTEMAPGDRAPHALFYRKDITTGYRCCQGKVGCVEDGNRLHLDQLERNGRKSALRLNYDLGLADDAEPTAPGGENFTSSAERVSPAEVVCGVA
jgi:hypothetical protein